jgi:hypothetical protein
VARVSLARVWSASLVAAYIELLVCRCTSSPIYL